jgi:hypothetical protein
MGRKGVGKLAPFGVCEKVEIITSGGEPTTGKDEHGKIQKGYLTAHLILDKSKIIEDTDAAYYPIVGELDGVVRLKSGTTLKLGIFEQRRVPEINILERQVARRFGLSSSNWRIMLIDSLKTATNPEFSRVIGRFAVEKMENTDIRFEETPGSDGSAPAPENYRVIGPDGNDLSDAIAGFTYEGSFYPVTGWVAYAKHPYKDDLMAGVRIYCRGKIAARTSIFNMKAGFTGEYDIRSYLVGELHGDWLDEEEDLIRTDRQDILWSHELCQQFESWGQKLVKRVGNLTRQPKRKRAWELFEETSKINEKVERAFPSEKQKEIRENTIEIAKVIAERTREEDLQEPEHVESLVQLSLLFGPQITLDRKLREAAESKDDPLSVITGILATAKIAELAAFGKIADDRIKVIKKIERLKDDPNTLESAFQSLIADAPWLINPQWSPLTANQWFSTLKKEFQKYYKNQTGNDLILDDFTDQEKRADFVLSTQDNKIQIIEIKKPNHGLENDEMDRLNNYVTIMKKFLNQPGNEEFRKLFAEFHVTLVCDELNLTGVHKTAFEGLKEKKLLTCISWHVFLLRTRRMHEEFLNEADKQRKYASKK